jgi:cell division protease FtsH
MTYLEGLPIARASVIGTTSGVGGMVMQEEKPEQFTFKKEIISQVKIAYSGRCSEQIKFGDVTTGASSDITQATRLIQGYVERFGFGELGMLDMGVFKEEMPQMGAERIHRMSVLAKEIEKSAKEDIEKNYRLVEIIAEKLLAEETLSGSEIKEMLDEELENAVKPGFLK